LGEETCARHIGILSPATKQKGRLTRAALMIIIVLLNRMLYRDP
jgi:hypothetical protein